MVTSILIVLIWLAFGILVVRFVVRTGGTKLGMVAHWFGGVFVMVGLAIGLMWVFSMVDGNFRDRVNVYVVTHQTRPNTTQPLYQRHDHDAYVTVYRHGSVNTKAAIIGERVHIDERQTMHTSWWWLLFDTKYSVR